MSIHRARPSGAGDMIVSQGRWFVTNVLSHMYFKQPSELFCKEIWNHRLTQDYQKR